MIAETSFVHLRNDRRYYLDCTKTNKRQKTASLSKGQSYYAI
jgi:hypothetical protein